MSQTPSTPATAAATGPFVLPPLPWKDDALQPFVSAQTISFHYGKHHKAYVDNLNNLAKGKPWEKMTLEEVVKASAKDSAAQGVFNNSAQIWNHTFFWHSMRPNGGGAPTGKLLEKITADFGSFDAFKTQFADAAKTQFGSGWAWLVLEGGKLKVVKTPNAETPLTGAAKPLLTCDVWEHAYYLDYQNRRPDYVTTFLDKLANWEFAAKNL
ncbi:MAG: superoxide dismutase [Planctomycetota bacterium]|nr:superoxide dismutase [Planctomycetota bacterium]